MKFIRANIDYHQEIHTIIHKTIDEVYPKYYPKGVVQFFKDYHSLDNVTKAIEEEYVLLLEDEGKILGTGSVFRNEIKRMFILPEYQGKGYGSLMMEQLEKKAQIDGYEVSILDASLPGYSLYEKKGYNTVKQNRIITNDGSVLCYSEMKKILSNGSYKIDYNNRMFKSVSNSENGEVSGSTVFSYRQQDNIIWADYCGGEILKGYLLGITDKEGVLNFTYQHINVENQIRTGKCKSTPKIQDDGSIKLLEEWQWTNGDESKGSSELEEIKIPR